MHLGTCGSEKPSLNYSCIALSDAGMEKCIATFRKHYLEEVNDDVRHACHLQLVLKDGSVGQHEQAPIKQEDIFKPVRKTGRTHTPVKRVIIEGCAGMGKSTFCISVARDWASSVLFQEYELLLLLPLSQRKIASASSLRGWIDGLKLKINSRGVANHIKHKKGEGVLLIADGWNDLRESERQVFRSLIFGDVLSCASVIVTSRPTASAALYRGNVVDRVIEILGLNRQGIEEYVLSKLAGNHPTADNLIDQLNCNPVVQSMCRVPICCASVCHLLYSHCGVLPISMTELCTKLILSILCNNCSTSISDLDSLQKPLQEPWRHLCKLAFQLISRGDPDILQFNSFQCGIMTFGFVEYDETKEDVKAFDFSYPTSQEYLAALHLVKQPPSNQLQALDTIRLTCKETTLFWRYFFGLSVKFNQHHFTNILKHGVQVIGTYDLPQCLLCHCAFEAKSEVVTSQIIKCLRNNVDSKSFVHFGDPCSAHDCEAVLYVISNMKGSECDGIEINFNNCNFSARQASALADMLALKMGKIQVKDLDISDNSLPDDTVAHLFSKAVTSFRSIEKLFIRNNGVSQKGISAIIEALSASLSKTLVQLDLSFNPLTLAGLQVLNCAIKSGILANLAILFMQGCLTSNVSENVSYLCSLAYNLLSRCLYLRRLDLSANDFGKGVTPILSRVIMQLSEKVDLRLNREYMSEVDKSFVAIMEDSIRRKGTIDHTVVHGVIVGPGRSGKNSLMNRLVGESPPDPNTISPSTGVLENVLKIEVKKLCTVAAAVNNLLWKRLDYDEEALELMMVTASSHTTVTVSNQAEISAISTNEPDDPISKKNITSAMILVEQETEESSSVDYLLEAVEENEILEVNVGSVTHMSNSKESEMKKPPPSNVKSSEGPLEIFKRAVKLRRMDALREHLESSWSLYLTNTGGQTEFQELLPLLVCGPSVFFITFPLHQSLHEHYVVDYQYSDGSHKTYPSSSTLMDEILQTLATIAALDCTGSWTDVSLKPKIFFVGTHKDKLPGDRVSDKVQAIDKQLQEKVRQTSLFKQGSIEFAVGTEKLIYTVNNLAEDDGDFKMIRLGLQKAVERCEEFTIKCPSTWLIFSLILRAKHKSSQVLSYNECYTIAQRCGISDRTELNDALFFIHTRLGLLRYFCVEKLNKLVVIDPQIMFDTITKVLVETFVSDHAKVNEIEEFQKRGIISQKVIKRISSKRSRLQSQLPFEWILCLLDHLRIAAFFMNKGEKCYFVPSALCHAPEQETKPSIILPINHETPPPLLIAFESGFCPRGIPGALITYLMTNEMKSKISWKLHSNRVFRNQVSFGVGPCDVILEVLSTHLEVNFDPESEVSELSEMKVTCEEAFNQLRQAMRTVTKGYRECNYYFAFNCTRSECEGNVHPAKIELDSKKLKCERINRRTRLPQHYDLWIPLFDEGELYIV